MNLLIFNNFISSFLIQSLKFYRDTKDLCLIHKSRKSTSKNLQKHKTKHTEYHTTDNTQGQLLTV